MRQERIRIRQAAKVVRATPAYASLVLDLAVMIPHIASPLMSEADQFEFGTGLDSIERWER